MRLQQVDSSNNILLVYLLPHRELWLYITIQKKYTYVREQKYFLVYIPFSAKSDQHQFSPNDNSTVFNRKGYEN